MSKFSLDLSKFKKESSDGNTSTLVHPQGHKIVIAHKALSPKMRGDIAAMPTHKDEKADRNKSKNSVKMAEGGAVTQHQKDMAAMQAGAMGKPVEKESEDYSASSSIPITKPSAPNANDEAYKASVQKFNAQMNQPGMAKGGEVKKYAEGTPDAPIQDVDYQQLPEQQPSDAAPPKQAPVIVNVHNAPPQQASAPESEVPTGQGVGHYIGNIVRQSVGDAIGAFKTVGAPLVHGVEGLVQGASGQPLAPIPSSDTPATPGVGPSGGPAPASVPNSPGATPTPQPDNSDPYGMQAYQDAYLKGLQEQKAGLQGQATASGAEGTQEAAALQKSQETKQQLMDHYQASYKELDDERKAVLSDYKNQHIDPNHFWANRSTVGKVGTVIGLILGGIGGGDNSGVAMLNRQIDRDIDAQRMNLGKTDNILKANMQQFGNLKDASDMTRLMQIDQVKDQLAQAAAQAKGPLEKARAQQAIGQLDQQAAPIQQQIAMRKTLLKGASSGLIDPERAVEMILPDNAKPEARKELKEARDMVSFRDNALSAFDQLSKIDTVGNRVKHLGFSPPQVEALVQPLEAVLGKELAGRFTEADAKTIGTLLRGTGKSDETRALQRSQLNKFITEKMHFPVLKGQFGLDQAVLNSGRYDMRGQPRGVNFTPGTAK